MTKSLTGHHPRLYKTDTKGKVRFWSVKEDGHGSYRTTAGLLDGKAVTSEWTVCEPKNVGRSNETSPADQCAAEVQALYTKKRDKHYVDSVEELAEPRKYFEVMLAHPWADHKHKIDWSRDDVFVQPKLDGLRGPTTKDGSFSRDGNEFATVRFISQEALAPLFELYPSVVIDGELYNHDLRADFNEIVSTIKRGTVTDAGVAKARELAQLHVYDAFFPDEPHLPFHERRLRLSILIEGGFMNGRELDPQVDPRYVKRVVTRTVCSEAEADAAHEAFLEQEYEGSVVRVDWRYEHKRTDKLLKRKEFFEAEYPIARVEEGSGNWSGAAKRVVCTLPDGREFGSGLKGKRAWARQVLAEVRENPAAYQTATIRYPQLTPDGVPRFGIAKSLYHGARDD